MVTIEMIDARPVVIKQASESAGVTQLEHEARILGLARSIRSLVDNT